MSPNDIHVIELSKCNTYLISVFHILLMEYKYYKGEELLTFSELNKTKFNIITTTFTKKMILKVWNSGIVTDQLNPFKKTGQCYSYL